MVTLQDWIQLSTMREIPTSLLIFSRAFQYHTDSEIEREQMLEGARM